MVSSPVFITKGTLWKIRTPPLVPCTVIQSHIPSQSIWYRWPGQVPVQAKVFFQDRNMACVLLWRVDLLLLVSLKHLYHSPGVSLSPQDDWEEQHDVKTLQCHCEISVTYCDGLLNCMELVEMA